MWPLNFKATVTDTRMKHFFQVETVFWLWSQGHGKIHGRCPDLAATQKDALTEIMGSLDLRLLKVKKAINNFSESNQTLGE